MFGKFLITLTFLLLVWPLADASSQRNQGHVHNGEAGSEENSDFDGHENPEHHDHESRADQKLSGEHTVNEHSNNEVHAGHSDELIIELSEAAVELASIEISEVESGRIGKTIELPGEIGFNEDRLADISPRFAGIALQANYRVGDFVEEGNVVAIIESNESMNSYSIKAPISGWVIERHVTPGEFVSGENSIYVIADLSTVWINLAVYPKDADRIKKGQLARIKAVGSGNVTSGAIEYVTPIIDLRTRSAVARITLPNPNNSWRPGTFVQAEVTTETGNQSLVVRKEAVQFLDEKTVIFVPDGPGRYRPVEVLTGETDTDYIQILSGLSEGIRYVSDGAFELKAKIITSNLDAHAGHGH
ncbi:MAG TPA: HlyD family efflux transporter periplasmic adaptor subunit [candidate division Zixibacteria bacterium]|nr:HlyD family efflux transporter periplasmic adaptor subunit [candidate division Zixibacteria bacterium]HEQ98752.1 HlyD family efflux transporter periplasmic adaptor subunit [candidate division Zixibacteria bacterium]